MLIWVPGHRGSILATATTLILVLILGLSLRVCGEPKAHARLNCHELNRLRWCLISPSVQNGLCGLSRGRSWPTRGLSEAGYPGGQAWVGEMPQGPVGVNPQAFLRSYPMWHVGIHPIGRASRHPYYDCESRVSKVRDRCHDEDKCQGHSGVAYELPRFVSGLAGMRGPGPDQG